MSEAEEHKPIYSPVPARAMGDPALSGADLRVLMAVASHDRFGKNGTGCFASHARLSSILNMHPKAVARSLGNLRDRGYLTVGRNPMNARLAVYSIIYTDDDADVMRGDGRPGVRPTRPRAVETNGNRTATEAPRERRRLDRAESPGGRGVEVAGLGGNGNSPATGWAPTGNSLKRKAEKNQSAVSPNIFPEGDNRLGEALSRRDFDRGGGEAEEITRAERVAGEAQSGEIEPGDAVEALRRIADRLRCRGAVEGEARVVAMIRAVEADAPGGCELGGAPPAILAEARPSPALRRWLSNQHRAAG